MMVRSSLEELGLPTVPRRQILIMTGDLLQIVAYGAGAISIDNRRAKDRAQIGAAALDS
jgi:hypothetical protein